MKNYNEMAQDVLRRMDEYETAKKRRHARLAKGAVSVCSLALVLLLGISLRLNGLQAPEIPATIDDALYPGIPDIIDDRTTPTITEPTTPQVSLSEDSIIINEMVSAPDASNMGIALLWDDFIAMDKIELSAYYGINVFPAVPTGLTEWDNQSYGIYCRDGGSGQVYWEHNALNFSNEDQTRWICITVSKGSLPFGFSAFTDPTTQSSVINDIEVMIGQWDADCYYAEFLYKDVGFRVTAEGLTQDELVAVIESLIV